MKYLVLAPDYSGSCIRNEFGEKVELGTLELPCSLIEEIDNWHNSYKKIIPLSIEERAKKTRYIETLDEKGLMIISKLEKGIPGGAKIKYYSEGKLRYILTG